MQARPPAGRASPTARWCRRPPTARLPSSARNPCASLSRASATTATQGPASSGAAREIAKHRGDVERHMRAVEHDRQRPDPAGEREALHPADEAGAGARPGVEQGRADRRARRAAVTPLRPSASRTAPASATFVASIVAPLPASLTTTAQPSARARACATRPASSSAASVVVRIAPGFKMPAFSPAIAARVSPRISVCSSPMLVTTAISPSTMLVEFEPAAQAHLDDRPFDARRRGR